LVFVFFQTFIRIMPFWVMYGICNINGFLLHKVIRYRRKIVDRNLRNSFPEKSDKEIKKLARQFYRYFADMLFEAGKGYRMTRSNLDKRYRFQNQEVIDDFYKDGKSVILLLAHFNNWEWITGTMGERFKHKTFALFKPFSNKYIDAFIRKSREHRNFNVVPIANTGLMFRNINKQPSVFVMAADQCPLDTSKAYWVEFLHQTTGFLHGPERYAHKFDVAVVFMKVLKTRRGYYNITFVPVAANPRDCAEGYITARYAQLLEETIREQPPRWLWSHKRWKRSKPADKEITNIK